MSPAAATHAGHSIGDVNSLRSRIGHSMVFNDRARQLYVFNGQRNKDQLSDFFVYDLDSDTVVEIARDSSKQGGPEPSFTQRATIDTEQGELYVLSGLLLEKQAQSDVKNAFWVFNLRRGKWTKVYQQEVTDVDYWATAGRHTEPCPRFAHQLVYHRPTRMHYMFGGNPGESGNTNVRLDDFWRIQLTRPSHEQLLRRALFLLRKQQFRELCGRNTMTALHFLQNDLAAVVDHADPEASAAFRALSAALFQSDNKSADVLDSARLFELRTELFEALLDFFPDHMKQPKANLTDLVARNADRGAADDGLAEGRRA